MYDVDGNNYKEVIEYFLGDFSDKNHIFLEAKMASEQHAKKANMDDDIPRMKKSFMFGYIEAFYKSVTKCIISGLEESNLNIEFISQFYDISIEDIQIIHSRITNGHIKLKPEEKVVQNI